MTKYDMTAIRYLDSAIKLNKNPTNLPSLRIQRGFIILCPESENPVFSISTNSILSAQLFSIIYAEVSKEKRRTKSGCVRHTEGETKIYNRYYDCGVDIDFSDSIYFLQVSLVKPDHKGNRECLIYAVCGVLQMPNSTTLKERNCDNYHEGFI